MVSSRGLSLFWFAIEKSDDVTSSIEMTSHPTVLKSPTEGNGRQRKNTDKKLSSLQAIQLKEMDHSN